MFVVTVLFVAYRNASAELRRELISNATASRETEPGCLQFDVCVDPDDPTTIFLYELYDDRAGFDAHLATEHFRRFDALSRDWIARKDVKVYERIDPA